MEGNEVCLLVELVQFHVLHSGPLLERFALVDIVAENLAAKAQADVNEALANLSSSNHTGCLRLGLPYLAVHVPAEEAFQLEV